MKRVIIQKGYKKGNNISNIDGISPLCQFHLVDEHTRHGSLIETSLVKVLRRDHHHDDNVNKNALKYQEIKRCTINMHF